MIGKLIYSMLLLALMLYSSWQWMHFELPALEHAIVPPVLPEVVVHKQHLETLLAHNLWDKSRGSSGPKANSELAAKQALALTWTLKGIGYQQMHAPVAVIASGDRVRLYHEGDTLPDKARLVQVMARAILVEKDGNERYVYLFKKK